MSFCTRATSRFARFAPALKIGSVSEGAHVQAEEPALNSPLSGALSVPALPVSVMFGKKAARGTFDNQIASLERFTAAERRRLELAQLLYKNGQASYLDVLTAQTDLYNAEQVLVSARLQRLTNIVDLYRALGGGWLGHTGDAPRAGDAATPQ